MNELKLNELSKAKMIRLRKKTIKSYFFVSTVLLKD